MQRLFWSRTSDFILYETHRGFAAKQPPRQSSNYCWREGVPPTSSICVVESLLVQNGRVHSKQAHEERFCAGLNQLGASITNSELRQFWDAVWQLLPKNGSWFPRVEAYPLADNAARLACWLRPAPALKTGAKLWVYTGADVRTQPTIKGPDLATLAEIRGRAAARGADDALLVGENGRVLETTTAAVLWWRGDTLCCVPPGKTLASTTVAAVADIALLLGYKVAREWVTLNELRECEVWIVNALHGIRVVTEICGEFADSVAVPAGAERVLGRAEEIPAVWERKPVSENRSRAGENGAFTSWELASQLENWASGLGEQALTGVGLLPAGENYGVFVNKQRFKKFCDAYTRGAVVLSDGRAPGGCDFELVSSKIEFSGNLELLFEKFFRGSENAFWLDSSRVIEGLSQFSIMGHSIGHAAETLTARAGSGVVLCHTGAGERTATTALEGDIFSVLEHRIATTKVAQRDEFPFDYAGGYVGYLGYGLKAECGSANEYKASEQDSVWVRATHTFVYDHAACELWILVLTGSAHIASAEQWISNAKNTICGLYDTDALRDSHSAGETARVAPEGLLSESVMLEGVALKQVSAGSITAEPGAPGSDAPGGRDPLATAALVEHDAQTYTALVERAQRVLQAGDSYEVCLTSRIKMPVTGAAGCAATGRDAAGYNETGYDEAEFAWRAYRRLRSLNPAPYAAFLQLNGLRVLCSSPERFLKISAFGECETKPIKGTVRRGRTAAEDEILRARLGADAKTRAENLMIVDLLRNDLSRVCERGSVQVPAFMRVESYATVHQLVSTITGRLRADVSAPAAARACFPGGSMTGAPKISTMRIIENLERRARGVYAGSLGFFSFNGAADLNIVIRTAVIQNGSCEIGAGGAVVLDSEPTAEYEEMLLKASVVAEAVLNSSRAG
nr:chorismate-binding protein [Canibacter zhuwentaonis]